MDGSRPDVLQDLLKQGRLPNLQKYLVEKGACESILSVFPSTTGPAYLPFLTGCFPGTCEVPGIRWFDKPTYAKKGWSFKSFRSYVGLETFLLNQDIRSDIQTTFDLFDRPLNYLSGIYRGIQNENNKTRYSRIWYYYYAHLTDRWDFVDRAMTQRVVHQIQTDPDFDFAFIVYPSVDEFAHRSSPFNPRTLKAYEEFDDNIGQIISALKQDGSLDETLMVLVADHGLSETHTHFDVGPYLEKEKNLKTFYYPQILKRNFDAASMVSGNGMVHLSFKTNDGWARRKYFEDFSKEGLFLDELRLRPEVALVATQGEDGAIHVHTYKGHGYYKFENNQIVYQWNHEEPLGLNLSSEDKDRCLVKLSENESIDLSFDSHYPDVFVQLKQLFSTSRSGDVILSAHSGYDFRKKFEVPEHKASHGAICPEHMMIPLVMNHPIQNLKSKIGREKIRSVDVFPTMLELMGKKIPDGIDGVSLV